MISHQIELEHGASPVKMKGYPVSPAIQHQMKEEVEEMLRKGYVRPSISPWSANVLMVPKPGSEKRRLVVDYRALNSRIKSNAYPIPFISSILDQLKNANFLSAIDLKNAYWQVELEESSRPLTAFQVPNFGLFEFNVYPMGLKTSGCVFQELMNTLFKDMLGNGVFAYLDDILVATDTFDNHLSLLEKVLERLCRVGLVLNWEKSKFAQSSLLYLGHRVGQGMIGVNEDRIKSVQQFPTPRTVKDVRSFLGMASWYRRFIPKFSDIAAPLNELLKKSTKWKWENNEETAFEQLKHKLTHAPVLACPDFDVPFKIECDCSSFGLGAVLLQTQHGEEKVIAFYSRSLSPAERNYSTTEMELLAVIASLEKFRAYFEGTRVTVVTDHASLKWLQNIKNPTGRLARWLTRLGVFDIDIQYRRGSTMKVADSLSRHPVSAAIQGDEAPVIQPSTEWTQTADPWFVQLRKDIKEHPSHYPLFSVVDNLIYKQIKVRDEVREVLVVPTCEREKILSLHHDDITAGHPGVQKTLKRLQQFYYWPCMYSHVKKYVRNCQTCQKFKVKRTQPAGLMRPKESMQRPWHTVATDLIGPLPMSRKQNRFCLVFVDTASRWVVAVPIRRATAKDVCFHFRDKIIFQFGCPDIVLCDNGSQYTSKLFQDLLKVYSVKLFTTPFYSPSQNPTERQNQVLKNMLSMFCSENQRDWDERLPYLTFAINTNTSEATGFSPAELNFARVFRGPKEPFTF